MDYREIGGEQMMTLEVEVGGVFFAEAAMRACRPSSRKSAHPGHRARRQRLIRTSLRMQKK
jgi:hypothetical protein